MKTNLIILSGIALALSQYSFGQQSLNQKVKIREVDSLSFNTTTESIGFLKKNKGTKVPVSEGFFKDVPTFGLYGIGNLNTVPDFEAINGAGKLAGFFRPHISNSNYVTANFSFNKNASNTDTLLASTFLFPDVGQSSFAGTIEWAILLGKPKMRSTSGERKQTNFNLIVPFYEFANKSIKGKLSKEAEEEYKFETLTHTVGTRFQFSMHRFEDDISFGLTPYLSFVNVPNEDNQSYRTLFDYEDMPSSINSWGMKVVFQYNNFQVFADFRNVYNIKGENLNEKVRSIQGFNSNIGFIFNAEVFSR